MFIVSYQIIIHWDGKHYNGKTAGLTSALL